MDRRYPIETFDPERFAPFFGNSAKQLQHELLSGGACNSNYLVHTPDGQRTVCRQHQRGNPLQEKHVTRIASELIPCPEYLWVGKNESVQTYIEGQHFEPSPQLMQQAGRIIGQLSTIRFERASELQVDGNITAFDGWNSYEESLFQLLEQPQIQAHLTQPQLKGIEQLLRRETATLADFDACHNLVHGDFRPDNLIIADQQIAAVIDWEFAHSGCSYMDVGNFLRHHSPEWEAPFKAGLEDAGFHLADDWRYRASLIDLSSHLEFLTSNRSDSFKQSCIDKIQTLLDLKR